MFMDRIFDKGFGAFQRGKARKLFVKKRSLH